MELDTELLLQEARESIEAARTYRRELQQRLKGLHLARQQRAKNNKLRFATEAFYPLPVNQPDEAKCHCGLHFGDKSQHVKTNRQTQLSARIGKMKWRKQDEGQRDGSCMMEDDSVDTENENNNRFEEYEWCGQNWIRATTLLEGGFRGSGFVMCSDKENPGSDADLDVDGDNTLEYGKPQYTEADGIPCTGEQPGEAKEREALRGAVLTGGTPSTRITPEYS
uniref:Uncharacterized protein n=1 Tax=Sphaerodactylus townsendi TaxID=933632 RepID=A0ACB8EN47_9SAUR